MLPPCLRAQLIVFPCLAHSDTRNPMLHQVALKVADIGHLGEVLPVHERCVCVCVPLSCTLTWMLGRTGWMGRVVSRQLRVIRMGWCVKKRNESPPNDATEG